MGARTRGRDAALTAYVWRPQRGPQHAFVKCPIFEVMYGGARGGGKTDASLGDFALHQKRYGRSAKGIFFRRELPQLEAAIARSKEIYYPLGAEWKEQPKTWVFPSGATVKFRPLERDGDAEKYQGHDYTRTYFEELTNYPDPKPVMKIKATLRSAHGVPVGFRASANPGGPGHQWVKERYIDPYPSGRKILEDEHGLKRIFIPAKVSDNQLLLANDPGYVARLQQSGSKELVRAWLEGDWDVIEGAYFDNWSHARHVVRPFEIPDYWLRFRSLDWGSARPFSVGWWAVASEHFKAPDGHFIPKGALVRYREWYGKREPNVGLKMTAEQVAAGLLERETEDEEISYSVADPSIFIVDGGPSIAERFFSKGIRWQRGDNRRVGSKGAMGGWDQVRARLDGEDGHPRLFVFSTCGDLIRTLPALQHDERQPENVDTQSEDHAADEARYACMSRPYHKPVPVSFEQSITRRPTLDELYSLEAGKKRERI